MFTFFKKKTNEDEPKIITLQLNDRCSPVVRGQLYREPLDTQKQTRERQENTPSL